MIVSLASGCIQQAGPAAKANNRSTKEEIQAAGAQEGTGSGTNTSTTGDEILGTQPDFSLTYFDHIKALIDAHCVSCHGDPATGGAPSDFTLATYETVAGKLGVYAKRDRIAARLEAGTMPPSGSSIPDADRTKILAWLAAGATRGADPAASFPTASFVKPAAAAETPTLGSYTIEVAFTKAPDDSYYNLYYNSTGSTTGGTLIMSDIPTSDLTTPWTTSALTVGGDFFVYLELYDGEGTKLLSKASTGTIHVDNSTPTNHAPTVAITGVFNGSTKALGTVALDAALPLSLSATDSDADSLTLTIEYRVSDVSPFVQIFSGPMPVTTPTWDTSALSEGTTYRLRVTASDGSLTTTATSAATFGVTGTDYFYDQGTLKPIFDDNCDSCHAGAPSGRFFDSDDLASAQYFADSTHNPAANGHNHFSTDGIVDRVMSNSMPQGGPALSSGDKAKIQLWYWQGAR